MAKMTDNLTNGSRYHRIANKFTIKLSRYCSHFLAIQSTSWAYEGIECCFGVENIVNIDPSKTFAGEKVDNQIPIESIIDEFQWATQLLPTDP